jgi:hypothetical protein
MELHFTVFGRESAAATFLYETINKAHPLFPPPSLTNGAAFVPDSETCFAKGGLKIAAR